MHFVTGDATCLPIRAQLDLAVCMTNTWGTMNDQRGVLNDMRRCVPQPRMRLLSVFAEASVTARREWYRRLGHTVVQESAEYLMTEGGFGLNTSPRRACNPSSETARFVPVPTSRTTKDIKRSDRIPLRVAARVPQMIGTVRHLRSDMREERFCAILFQTARKPLILKRRDVRVV